MIANLDKQEIDKVWQYADIIPNVDSSKKRLDCLGAIVSKKDYANEGSNFGWYAEFVLSPSVLSHEGISLENILCEANIRILQIDNYKLNIGHNIGQYTQRVIRAGDHNVIKPMPWYPSFTPQEGIENLKKQFNLNDEQIKKWFLYV